MNQGIRGWLRVVAELACLASVLLSGAAPALADDAPAAPPTVAVAQTDALGPLLTDANGQTVYLFTRDAPDVSNCSGGCATTWPPVLVTDTPVAPSDLVGVLDMIARADGSTQLTYNHQPLYYYAGDTQPGTTAGQGVGGVWFVVAPSDPVAAEASASAPASPATQAPPAPAAPAAPAATPTVRSGYQDTKGYDYGY